MSGDTRYVPEVLIDLGSGEPPPREPSGRRTSAAAGLAVALVVLLGSTALWYSRQPHVAVEVAMISEAGADMPLKQFPAFVNFVDASNGYMALATCARRRLDRCSLELWVTADAGVTWQRRSLPLSTAALLAVSGMGVLNHETVTMDLSPAGPLRRGPAVRWLSWDGGRSWREVSSPPGGSVPDVPTGARLVLALDAPLETRLQVLNLDGTWAWLEVGPADKEFQPAAVLAASDGSLWLKGYQRNAPSIGVFVSRDRGRSWQRLPQRGDEFTTVDGRSLYFLSGAMDDRPTLTYSRDGGATWVDLTLPRPDRVPLDPRVEPGDAAIMASMAALPDGSLIVAKNGLVRRLDGVTDRMVTVAGFGPVLGVVQAGPYAIGVGERTWLSGDGATWKPLRVG